MSQYTVQYFALLREQAGLREERIDSPALTPAMLYTELQARHGFTLKQAFLRVAVNDEFVEWTHALQPGDRLVFIPPVAGG